MSDEQQPSASGSSGRDNRGRFGAGNAFSKGNPHAKKTAQIRAALFAAVKPSDIKRAVQKIMQQAVAGDRFALAEILDRTVGKAIAMDLEERMQRLEQLLLSRDSGDE